MVPRSSTNSGNRTSIQRKQIANIDNMVEEEKAQLTDALELVKEGVSEEEWVQLGLKDKWNATLFRHSAHELADFLNDTTYFTDAYIEYIVGAGRIHGVDIDEIAYSLTLMHRSLQQVLEEELSKRNAPGGQFSSTTTVRDAMHLYLEDENHNFRVKLSLVESLFRPGFLLKLFEVWLTEITDVPTFVSMPDEWQQEYWSNIVQNLLGDTFDDLIYDLLEDMASEQEKGGLSI